MKASEFLKKLKTLTKEDLIEIKGLGDVLTDNFLEFVESERYNKLLEDFAKLEEEGKGVEISESQKKQTNYGKLAEKTICITGKFTLSRSQIKTKLEELGAKVTSSITSKTDILLAGEDTGSKLEKAESLGVVIVNDLDEIIQP